MADRDETLPPEMDLEAEGIPDVEDHPPGKVQTGDTQEGLVPHRDYPLAVEEHGTTAAEESRGETLAQRVAREEPEVPGLPEEAGPLQEDEYVPAARLLQPDEGTLGGDETPEEVALEVDDAAALRGEEAAVHLEEEPGGLGGGWPGYLDEQA